jgi:hypothetical protein
MMKHLIVSALAVCLGTAGLFAQADAPAAEQPAAQPAAGQQGTAASSEDEFFGSADVEAKQGTAEKQNVADVVEKEHVGLSGQLQAQSSYTMTRNFVQGITNASDNSFSNVIDGDFLVDIRLQKSFKAFLDLNLAYVPGGLPVMHTITPVGWPWLPPAPSLTYFENQDTTLLIKEVFVDFNLANTVYFRAGKQVLKWGTGYFWNPTDLINIEHRSFYNPNALLVGVFGLRSDVVFSPKWHLYTFVNLNGVQDITTTAFAARSEFLVGATEFAASAWLKSGKLPVFGADLTTPLFWSLNLTSEASFSWGDNQDKLNISGNPYSVRDQLVPKIDVGLSRTFDALDVQDRVSVNLEFFYNSDGYGQNMFSLLNQLGKIPTFVSCYYQSGYYGQYYGAAFVTINDFGSTNMTLSLNALANFSDMSAIALVGLSYAPVNNFTLSLQVGSYLGADVREFTISVNPTTGALTNNQLFGILGATVNF